MTHAVVFPFFPATSNVICACGFTHSILVSTPLKLITFSTSYCDDAEWCATTTVVDAKPARHAARTAMKTVCFSITKLLENAGTPASWSLGFLSIYSRELEK